MDERRTHDRYDVDLRPLLGAILVLGSPSLVALGGEWESLEPEPAWAANALGAGPWETDSPFPFSQWKDPDNSNEALRDTGTWFASDPFWYYEVTLAAGWHAGQEIRVMSEGESWTDFLAVHVMPPDPALPVAERVPFSVVPKPRLEDEVLVAILDSGEQPDRSHAMAIIKIETAWLARMWGSLPAGDYRFRFVYDSRSSRKLTPIFCATRKEPPTPVLEAKTDDDRDNQAFREQYRLRRQGDYDGAIAILETLHARRPMSLFLREPLAEMLENKSGWDSDIRPTDHERVAREVDIEMLRRAQKLYAEIKDGFIAHVNGIRIDPDFYPPEMILDYARHGGDPYRALQGTPQISAGDIAEWLSRWEEAEKKRKGGD